ncbi:hypothetical protein ABIF62_002413 [Bradyrhizobium japonicum]
MTSGSSAIGKVISIAGTGAKGRESGSHKFVIVADDPVNADWLVIPICSHHVGADGTCIISPADDNSLVTRKSYAAYYQAKLVVRGSHTVGHVVPADLLKRICDGINISDEVEPWFKTKYESLTNPPKKPGRILRRDGE